MSGGGGIGRRLRWSRIRDPDERREEEGRPFGWPPPSQPVRPCPQPRRRLESPFARARSLPTPPGACPPSHAHWPCSSPPCLHDSCTRLSPRRSPRAPRSGGLRLRSTCSALCVGASLSDAVAPREAENGFVGLRAARRRADAGQRERMCSGAAARHHRKPSCHFATAEFEASSRVRRIQTSTCARAGA